MTIQDCVALAAAFLDENDAAADLDSGNPGTHAELLERLHEAVCRVIDEIAAEYVPVRARTAVTVQNGFVPFSMLNGVLEVTGVTDENGGTLAYSIEPQGLRVNAVRCEVYYNRLPGRLQLADPLPFSTARVSARMVGYGAAAEYAMIAGMTDEAVLYDKRYKDALSAAGLKRGELKLKKRRWL